jgi:hypothetical protein
MTVYPRKHKLVLLLSFTFLSLSALTAVASDEQADVNAALYENLKRMEKLDGRSQGEFSLAIREQQIADGSASSNTPPSAQDANEAVNQNIARMSGFDGRIQQALATNSLKQPSIDHEMSNSAPTLQQSNTQKSETNADDVRTIKAMIYNANLTAHQRMKLIGYLSQF